MKIKAKIIASLFCLICITVIALAQQPTQTAQVPIVTIRLTEDQIASVKTAEGITTRLVFYDQIQEIICGDLYDPATGKGGFVIQRSGKDIFLKPVKPKGISNLFVKTGDKADYTYSFDLMIVPVPQAHRIVNVVKAQTGPVAATKPANFAYVKPITLPIVKVISISGGNSGDMPEEREMNPIPAGLQISPAFASALPAPPPAPLPEATSAPLKTARKQASSSLDDPLRRTPIKRVLPEYPDLARWSGASGMVVVEVTIDEAGKILAARALSGNVLLRSASVAAARMWTFSPLKSPQGKRQTISKITFNYLRQ